MIVSGVPAACDAVKLVREPEKVGLPHDAVIRCVRAAHGHDEHVGYLSAPGGSVHSHWHTLTP